MVAKVKGNFAKKHEKYVFPFIYSFLSVCVGAQSLERGMIWVAAVAASVPPSHTEHDVGGCLTMRFNFKIKT